MINPITMSASFFSAGSENFMAQSSNVIVE
jgi:hypothetical protein